MLSGQQVDSTRKRQRTDEPVKNEQMDGMSIVRRGPAHHHDLWFEDGNIILIAGGLMAFKLYRGILARHSPVLAARLVPENMTSYDGLPALPVPESPSDVESMLYWIFDTKKILSHTSPMVLQTVFAYYELGKTYGITHMRDEGFSRLADCYPSSLEKYPTCHDSRSRPIIWTRMQELEVAYFACKHELHSVAAAALYECCLEPLKLIPSHLHSLKLDGHLQASPGEGLLERILEGFPQLVAGRNRLIARLMKNVVDPSCKNKMSCRGCLRDILAGAMLRDDLQCAALEYQSLASEIDKENFICSLCKNFSVS